MVRIYMFTLFVSIAAFVNGQSVDSTGSYMVTYIEEAPIFDGDIEEFIQGELVYPIDTLGLTNNHKVVRGVRDDLNNEALRISKLITFDKPALQKGRPIVTVYTVPIVFDLQHTKKRN
jgi:protein TonB